MTRESLQERCQSLLTVLLKSNSWTLVQAGDPVFVDEVLRRVEALYPNGQDKTASISDESIRRAGKNVYCIRLYEAFKRDGSDRQIVAMTEVKHFVYRNLLLLTAGDERLSDECAQDAVHQAWLTWESIRVPEAFLGFVLRIGIHAKFAHDRKVKKQVDFIDETEGEQPAVMPLNPPETTEEIAEAGDLFGRVRKAIEHCLPKKAEADLVKEIFLNEKSFKELAKLMDVRTTQLHLLKFRALKKLRECQEFVDLWRSWQGGDNY
jgi:DNA-directed RNA polymerase specialized sigma24 family protein